MSSLHEDDKVIYARRTYDHIFEWYKNADTKAEIILTLDGIFITFITSLVFLKQTDLTEILPFFTPLTWILLAFMSLSAILSVAFAIICLWSRVSLFGSIGKEDYLNKNDVNPEKIETYTPASTWFFQYISWLDRENYQNYLLKAGKNFEVNALTENIYYLSINVLEKHQWVNWSFTLAGLSMISFFALGISYIISIVNSL